MNGDTFIGIVFCVSGATLIGNANVWGGLVLFLMGISIVYINT